MSADRRPSILFFDSACPGSLPPAFGLDPEDSVTIVGGVEFALALHISARPAGAGDTVSAVNQAEAARILGVHPATVSRWVAAGHFDLVEGPGKHPLIAAHNLHRPAPKSRRNRR